MGKVIRIDVDSNTDVSQLWRYAAVNYTDLTLNVAPTANEGELAIVYESQGIWLINRKLKGIYIYQSGVWVYANQELQDKIQENESNILQNRIEVTQSNVASTLGGTIDSTKEYFIDGIVDCSGIEIEVPSGGINIKGYDFDISKLICTDNNHTMFKSPVGGSGNVLFENIAIEVSGTSSKVYDLKSLTGFEAIEVAKINYNNCTSLGVIDNYRQGLETGTGRFGGKPELELKGVWLGGFLITTSIIRSLDNGAYTLFKAGTGFAMHSRFKNSMNVDLPTSASFTDFPGSAFPNPSTFQLQNMIVSRNGVIDSLDTNITPNMSSKGLPAYWKNNVGVSNTFIGGFTKVTTEVTTVISTIGIFVDLAGTFTTSDLQHFDSPSNGQLRHLGNSPTEYKVNGQFVLESTQNNVVEMQLLVWRDATSSFEVAGAIRRVIDRLQGVRDVAYYVGTANIVLNQNDYAKFQVANITSTGNITAELDSFYSVEER